MSALRVRRLAAGTPFAPFCCVLEADGECGQCSRWLLSSESVYSSSVQDGLYGGHPQLRTCLLLTILPRSSSALFVWALGVLCPFPAATPSTMPFQLHGEATSRVGRNECQFSQARFPIFQAHKTCHSLQVGVVHPYFLSGGGQAQMLLMDGKFRKQRLGNR